MTMQAVSALLQDTTTLALNTETLVGAEINCGGYDFITFFVKYTKGDETNVLLTPYFMAESGGDAFSHQDWSAVATRVQTEYVYSHGATGNLKITLDVRGVKFVKLMATADNTGTPTGTIKTWYALTK